MQEAFHQKTGAFPASPHVDNNSNVTIAMKTLAILQVRLWIAGH